MFSGKSIGVVNNPRKQSASGVWNLSNQFSARRSDLWPPTLPPAFVVFDETTGPVNAVTGNWTNFYTGGTTNSIMTLSSTTIGLRGPYWTDGVAETTNNINMIGATAIEIVVSASNVSPPHFYATFGWANTAGGYSGFSIGNPNNANYGITTHVIPVTDAGNGKIRLYVTNSDGGTVYLHSVKIRY